MKWEKCQICNEEKSKYKCPKCNIQFCSVGCFKNHKDTKCEVINSKEFKEIEPNPEITGLEDGEISSDTDEEETEDRVPKHRLQELGDCEVLTQMLENPHLRDMMTGLTKADNPRLAMDKAMQEPIFTEFTDQCLLIVEDKTSENTPPWS